MHFETYHICQNIQNIENIQLQYQKNVSVDKLDDILVNITIYVTEK